MFWTRKAPNAEVTSDGASHAAITDVNGTYTISGLEAGNYSITSSKIGYTFSPSTRQVAVGPNATGQDFIATPSTFSISGRVTHSDGITGVPDTQVSTDTSHTATTDAAGYYVISAVPAGAFTLTPIKTGFYFDPFFRTGVLNADLTGQDFAALANESIVLKADSGFNSNHLTWEPARNPAVGAYRIWRTTPTPDSAYFELATVNGLDYFDAFNITSGINYCYKVDALAYGNTVATSAVQCVVFGQINLWVPEMNGMKGNIITVPINIRNATGLNIASADIWLNYDESVLTCTNVTKTAMTVDFQWEANCLTPGRVVISTFASPPKAIAGNGSLFWLTFSVQGDIGDDSFLELVPFTPSIGGSSISTDPGSGIPVDVPLVLTSSTFHVEDGGLLGDVNNDKTVSGKDAYMALQISVGKITPDWRQQFAADVNGDGTINSADVSMILYYAAFASWPEVPMALNVGHIEVLNAGVTKVSLDSVSGDPGSVIPTTIRVENLQNWAGGDFIITFDPRLVESVSEVTAIGLASSANFAWFYNNNGSLRVSIASNVPLNGDGSLATIKLRLVTKPSIRSTPLVLAGARFHDLYGRDFEFSAIQGTITRINGSVTTKFMTFLPITMR